MKRADPKKGESGAYRLFTEGMDNDGDGFINEDPPGGVDINRNFAHEYPYNKPDAGPHMVSEAESRALMDWVLAHRNIAAILTFGESDNLIVAADERRPARAGPRARPRPLRRGVRGRGPDVGLHPDRREPSAGAAGSPEASSRSRCSWAAGAGGRPPGSRPSPRPSGRMMMPDRTAGDDGRHGRLRLLQGRLGQIHRADGHPPAPLRPRAPGRLLPVRLLPVRRPLLLDARLRPDDGRIAGRSAAWA